MQVLQLTDGLKRAKEHASGIGGQAWPDPLDI
jgi:hypothetical protein